MYCSRLHMCEQRLAEAHQMLADKEKLLAQACAANLALTRRQGAETPAPAAVTSSADGSLPIQQLCPVQGDLSNASTDVVCNWMRHHGLGHHEGLFRKHGLQGSDLVDLVAPDGHGFSTEQVRALTGQ